MCYTVLYYTMLYYTILYYTIVYYAMLYYGMLCCDILEYLLQWWRFCNGGDETQSLTRGWMSHPIPLYDIIPYSIGVYYPIPILSCPILYYTVLYYTILYYRMLCCDIL